MFNRLWIRIALTFAVVQILFVLVPFGIFITLNAFDVVDRQFEENDLSEIFSETDLTEEQQQAVFNELEDAMRRDIPGGIFRSAIFTAVVGVIAGIWVSRRLVRPLSDLEAGAQSLNLRQLDVHIDDSKGGQEIEAVAKAFNNMTQRLRHSEAVRKNLLADVAHELRTPLTVVQGNLRAMLDGVYPMNEEEVAGLFDQTQHLTRLVDDLHELANAEADQLSLDFEDVNVAEMVQACASAFRPLADEKEIELRPELLGKLPTISADRTRLTQAVNNLISNAMRHTPEKGTITVQAEQIPDWLEIRVSDTGEGIEPHHLPHVFDRFYRADASRQRHSDESGSGLGLAIARAVIEAHGGTISAESEGLRRGSRFTIQLPI